MYREVIDSYIFDVTKHLARKEKNQVQEDLRQDIYLRVEDFMEGLDYEEPTYEDIKVILADFGRPEDIVNSYGLDKYNSYIVKPLARHARGDFRLAWIFCALAIIGSFFLSFYLERPGLNIAKLVQTGGNLVLSFVLVYFANTLAFSWVSSKRYNKSADNYVSSLRALPSKANTIRKLGLYFQVIVSSFLLGVFAFSRNILNMSYPELVLFEELSVGIFPLIILVYLIDVISLAYKEADRRYTTGVLFSTVLKHLAIIGIVALMFAMYDMKTTLIYEALTRVLPANTFTIMLLDNLGTSIFFLILGISVLSIVYVAISFHSDKKAFGLKKIEEFDDYGEDQEYVEGTEDYQEDQTYLDDLEEYGEDQVVSEEAYIESIVDENPDLEGQEASDQDLEDLTIAYDKKDLETELEEDSSDFDDTMATTVISQTQVFSQEDLSLGEDSDQVQDETVVAYTKTTIEENLDQDQVDEDKVTSISDAIKRSNPSNKD